MPKKMRISFSGSPKEIELKQIRAKIQMKILNSKSKKEEEPLQRQMAQINKRLRALR